MHMKDLMGLSEYAKYRKSRGLPGGTTQSVFNAVNAGRIPTITVGKNRMVNPKAADHAWMLNTDWTRYTPEQIAAMEGKPPPNETTPPPVTHEAVRAEAWNLVFENAPVAAAVLLCELSIEPLAALQIASKAISTLLYCLGEGMGNSVYLASNVPAWAVAAMDGDLSSPDLIKALENVAAMAADLFTEDERQADELPS